MKYLSISLGGLLALATQYVSAQNGDGCTFFCQTDGPAIDVCERLGFQCGDVGFGGCDAPSGPDCNTVSDPDRCNQCYDTCACEVSIG
ncbi:hypothetical protein GGR57DRAFT_470096 [Xylariaceae sp. FL1272]|nr:hypothetical protein GGR57DRAFT_470096 [Xylariaceae sp. FL1272]